ncbi:hypothetical protein TNCV_4529531 [Trichonephila clavipes]|nr:hypothetical protein TNCV_4529531 [Trichonephila clavipes]
MTSGLRGLPLPRIRDVSGEGHIIHRKRSHALRGRQTRDERNARRDGVQKPRHVSLDVRNIVKYHFKAFKSQRIKQALCKTSLTRIANNAQLNNGGDRWSTPAAKHVAMSTVLTSFTEV